MKALAVYSCGNPTYDEAYRTELLSDLLRLDPEGERENLELDDIRLELFRTTSFLHRGVKDAHAH